MARNNELQIDDNCGKAIIDNFDKLRRILNMSKKFIRALEYLNYNAREVFS